MGLDINGIQSILYSKSLGVDFTRSATIGRQGLHLNPNDFKRIQKKFGYSFDDATIKQIFKETNGYAEGLFHRLGALDIHSFDISDYEKATYIHDMNQPIPECFKEQYSVVLDGGSLEHVFNFPVAIKNCMEMLQVGGHYIGITPGNNYMGHGFYQFSPELYFSIFTAENGYDMVSVIAFENKRKTKWFSVKNPAAVKGRVTLTNCKPVSLFIVAKRVKKITPLTSMPQQSDYISVWEKEKRTDDSSLLETDKRTNKREKLFTMTKKYTPDPVKNFVKSLLGLNRGRLGFNPNFYRLINRKDGLLLPDKKYRQTQ